MPWPSAKKTMRYVLAIICCAALAGFLAFLLVPYQTGIIADGGYDLTIRVKSKSRNPIKAVTCQAFGQLAWAQEMAEYLPGPQSYESYWVKAEPYAGEDLKLMIPFSEHIRTPMFGSPYLKSESQFRGLLVVAELENGKRVGTAVEIPHRKDARSVDVEVP
jgi:hypothetical protein